MLLGWVDSSRQMEWDIRINIWKTVLTQPTFGRYVQDSENLEGGGGMTFEQWWKENNFTFPRFSAHWAQVAKDIARAAWYAGKVVSSKIEPTTQHGAIEGKKG